MLFINYAAREINLKLVYYGPGLSGKTTNVRQIHSGADPAKRGALLQLETESDRTLFFDFLPVTVGRLNGFSVRFHIYSVPGQIHYEASRRLVMRGADGVVFVADSQEARFEANLESLESLDLDLVEHNLVGLPLVFQYNRRDVPSALPVPTLRRALNARGAPEFLSIASRGVGVQETLKGITRMVIQRLRGDRAVNS